MHPKKNSQIKVSLCKSLYKKVLSNESLFFVIVINKIIGLMCAVVMANHCNGLHLPGVSIHNKTYCKNYISLQEFVILIKL